MPSVFVIKEKLKNPMDWYCTKMKCPFRWEFDEKLGEYHLGTVYIKLCDHAVSFEDLSEEAFFGWETSSWVTLADGKELIYGFYHDNGNAEFVHIEKGVCVRDYRMYEFELETDKGSSPEFEDWAEVCDLIDDLL